MLKVKIKWELETGEVYEDWTIPFELAEVEKEFFNGAPITASIYQNEDFSNSQLLFLAYRIEKRITKKPMPNYELWVTKVINIERTDLYHPKVSKQAQ